MRKRNKYVLTVFALFLCLTCGAVCFTRERASAEENRSANLKILVTADLHGQVTARNYETDEEDRTVGLSKIATLIREERELAGENNTLLVDAGDTLYSYSTDFFYDYNPKLIQPIYQAMAVLDYDAVTLGNHELDYPWEYLMHQLEGSGLLEVTTVSNLLYDDSGEHVLPPSIVVEKELSVSGGTSRTVRIGVVGATRESLSSKRQRYSGFLCGMDVYSAVKEEAERLKAEGVDVVIALIHGGIGVKSGSDTSVDAGARLAKLDAIDAVVTSHTHEYFPLNRGVYAGYSYVDEETGLVHGTPVIAVGSHANTLGVINLTLDIAQDGAVSVSGGSSELIPVETITEEDQYIVEMHKKFQNCISRNIARTEEYALAEGCILTNVDCVVKDSALYQLINNAKMEFGNSYVQEYLPEYADYPVVAVTVNNLDDKKEYIYIEGSIDSTDVARVIGTASAERDSGYLYLYKISGKNLREWLEYSASIYAQAGTRFTTILPSFTVKNPSVSTLLQEEYLLDWSEFFVFDGISYGIDLSQPARYKSNGTLVSSENKRIVNLQYQGKAVTDAQTFIIVSDTFDVHYSFMPTAANSAYGLFPFIDGKDVVLDYVRKQAQYGELDVKPDNNWTFQVAENYEFAFGTLADALEYGKKQDWYYKHVSGTRIGLQFFWGKYIAPERQLQFVLSLSVTAETGQYVPVKVTVTSLPKGAQIESVIYRRGKVEGADDLNWQLATRVNDSVFNVSSNGIYSVLVTDTLGNQSIGYITVENVNPLIVAKPTVEMVTNRRRAVTGVAVAGGTVHVRTGDGTEYTATAASDGSFSVDMPPQKAGSVIEVWVSEGTRNSETVEIDIYRTGPNLPELLEAKAGNGYVLCRLEGNEIPMVIIGKTVYIEEGGSERYKKSEIYNPAYTITESRVEHMEDGSCKLYVTTLKKGNNLYFYALDWQNRESLRTVYSVK